jgi:Coenzyme PQQ synthesis protein D (PqqD)
MGIFKPIARTDGLLTEEVEGELLAYDERTDTAWRLNATAAVVWRGCDGTRTLADLGDLLAAELGIAADDDLVLMTLDDLVEHDMIASGYQPREAAAVRLSRRRFFGRVGVAGAAVAAPVVYSMTVPAAAAAISIYTASDRRLKRDIQTLRAPR